MLPTPTTRPTAAVMEPHLLPTLQTLPLLLPPPLPGGGAPRPFGEAGADTAGTGMSLRQRKLVLRDSNADLARELVRSTGWSHPQVNAELNRLSGITRISEATLEQLERRLTEGRKWLRTT